MNDKPLKPLDRHEALARRLWGEALLMCEVEMVRRSANETAVRLDQLAARRTEWLRLRRIK